MTFGHPIATRAFWRRLTQRALEAAATPFYVFSAEPIAGALSELRAWGAGLPMPVRHWLSCKTQPIRPLLQWWRKQGLGIEVVSEFELQAALREGFLPTQILVNGPAKHHWLPRHPVHGLWVNFDSPAELPTLIPLAKSLGWGVGVRVHTTEEFDPEEPSRPTQFGMMRAEAVAALKQLGRADLRLETVHFHLRTNVAAPAIYERAVDEVAAICRAARFLPKYLDCGGGLPPPHVLDRQGQRVDKQFDLAKLAVVYDRARRHFPGLEELWLENGRFLSARSGALVARVLDVKARGRARHLICDAGRTTQALVSNWEAHELLTLPERTGSACPTTVCGPTCMAFDQLARRELPRSLRVGDCLVWLEAGAYHIPWETRFSHGLAAVVWHENDHLAVVREREPFAAWWGQWK